MIQVALSAQTTTENYVETKTYKTPSKVWLNTQSPDSVTTSIQYFDEIGRLKQSVLVKGGAGNYSNNALAYDWNAGTPSNSGFYNLNGSSSENQIISGTTPFGDTDLLWECVNDATNGPDGGWNTDYIAVDESKAYRYTVWIKKTGSLTDGVSYHGTQYVDNLNGTFNGNPYFWYGDLPQIDTWYLMVGYIHPKGYTGGDIGVSGVYDIDGNKVIDGTEFKWSTNSHNKRFRNYLWGATNTSTRQYFWSPLVQKIDGDEDSLNDIINSTSVYNNEELLAKDIVNHVEYDGLGRKAKDYLPYASGNTDGRFESDAKLETHNYYLNHYADDFPGITDPEDANPFSKTNFENSPLNRAFEQTAPGLAWEEKETFVTDREYSSGNTIKLEYDLNALNEVRYFPVSVSLSNNTYTPSLGAASYYGPQELTKSITKDENWQEGDGNLHTTQEFKDKNGQVVLKRTFALIGGTTQEHDTYYIYDDYGNLTYVFPPKINTADGISASELSELAYQYVYDYRNRLVEKQIPGKGREYFVYDKLDRPILTQDALQRQSNDWLFTKYDGLGRVVYTGKWHDNAGDSRTDIQDDANAATTLYETKTTTSQILGDTSAYYSNSSFPDFDPSEAEIYTISYYDTYIDLPSGFTAPSSVYDVAFTSNTQGLSTVNKTRVLGTSDWITSISYYDEKARPIYVYSENDFLQTKDAVSSKLDFTGKVLETKTSHIKGTNAELITIDRFEYDHMDRLISQSQKVEDQISERIVKNNYNDLGQLKSKLAGNAAAKGYTSVTSGINISDDLITKTSTSNSWNVGLASIGTIQADGYVQFSPDTHGKFFVVGLATSNPNTTYAPMEHAIYIHTNNVFVFESGSNKGAMSTSYQVGDVFRIERVGNKIYYSHNGEVKYISGKHFSGTLMADVSMFHSGAKIKNLHIVDNSKGLQNMDYTYNVRGWLKNINEDAQNDNDLFDFSLRYHDPIGTNATPLFNGNISQSSWTTASDNDTNNPVSNSYTYQYDALNRITSALDNTGNYNLTGVSYDKNGNILTLQRTGHTNSSATTFGVMDDLYYTYLSNSNQLSIVRDNAPIDQFGFKDDALNQGSDTLADYAYDSNGNMTSDSNKGISNISYNHLNLPTLVNVSSQQGSITYTYDAAGIKQKKYVSGAGISPTTTEYAGNYIYENGTLQFFSHSEGYVKYENGSFDYVYQYKDHLGNVRLSYSDSNNNGLIEIAATTAGYYTEIVEESNYYPFGLKHKGYNNATSSNGNSVAQKFKYNGKELEESLGYAMYEYEARHYDAALTRFVTTDPLAEDYSFQNPYAYSVNSPVRFVDKLGMGPEDWIKNLETGVVKWYDAEGEDAIKLAAIDGQEKGVSFLSPLDNSIKSKYKNLGGSFFGVYGNPGDVAQIKDQQRKYLTTVSDKLNSEAGINYENIPGNSADITLDTLEDTFMGNGVNSADVPEEGSPIGQMIKKKVDDYLNDLVVGDPVKKIAKNEAEKLFKLKKGSIAKVLKKVKKIKRIGNMMFEDGKLGDGTLMNRPRNEAIQLFRKGVQPLLDHKALMNISKHQF